MRPPRSALALLGYALSAVLFLWPLPNNITGSLTGSVSGDTGVYVWNIWVFRHEIVAHGHLPLFTSKILALTPPIDLSLHNYTIFQDVLAFPLLPLLGVVATFNLVQLAMLTLTGFATYLLARRVTERDAEAWLAGLLFAFSPTMIAKSTAHFSLLAAAPLAFFLLLLLRVEQTGKLRDAALVGLVVAWAALCDAYYGIYCVLLFCVFAGARLVRMERHAPPMPLARVLDVLMLCLGGLVFGILASGGRRVQLLGITVSMRSAYTPMLLLTLTALVRLALVARPRVAAPGFDLKPIVGMLLAGGVVCATMLSPVLYALGHRMAEGGRLQEEIFWRSSPSGIDLAAWLLPNPNHPLAGSIWREWLTRERGDAFPEQVASLTFVAVAVVGLALWKRRQPLPRMWLAITVSFALLALGPFIRVAGIETYIPGPWALLRYVPIVGGARMPTRFVVPAMLAFSVLFAVCLARLATGPRRRMVLAVVGALLVFELWPAPRPLHTAEVPGIYRTIKEDPRGIRILELPFGIRDGVMSEGDFSASSQFYQTYHEKALIGGYLSRIPVSEVAKYRRFPLLSALLDLSERKPPDPGTERLAREDAQPLVERTRMGYVVIDTQRASPALREFAVSAFGLVKIAAEDGRELYRTEPGPSFNEPDGGAAQRVY
ncbi:MAG TPA: DUF2079 domain-containing protein [Vicinamibacterales bacterium]|nr:DUF2079 domain-containing protein [Vicinamibacterales bacterium]